MSSKSAAPLPQSHGRIAILFDALVVSFSLRKPSIKSRVSMYVGQIIGKYINHQNSTTAQYVGTIYIYASWEPVGLTRGTGVFHSCRPASSLGSSSNSAASVALRKTARSAEMRYGSSTMRTMASRRPFNPALSPW